MPYKNKEDARAWEREYYKKHRPEKLEYARRWAAAHPGRRTGASRKYRAEHLEESRAYSRKYTARDRADSPDKHRAYNLKYRCKKLGITVEQHNALVVEQGETCAICGMHTKKLVTDHNHKTGGVRGLLCDHCNWGLGHFKDNQAILKLAIEYLSKRG